MFGCTLFSSVGLIADTPMPSQVPVIVTAQPPQLNPQAGAVSGVNMRKATFIDPSTGMPVVYEVATFQNESGQTVEQYTNTETGNVSSRIMPGS
jgi:hypothetical protein